jgi:Sodium Bile acid symporter family
MQALAWLGRQGTRAIAALVVIGIATPPIGKLLKPFVFEAIFVLLTIAFMRVDPAAVRGYLRRPALVLAATVWTMLVIPIVVTAMAIALGLGVRAPELLLGVMLQAVASPMMAAPSFAALMGLDATLVLATLIVASMLTPLTAPLFTSAVIGRALTLSPFALGLRLLTIIVCSAIVGLLLRYLSRPATIDRFKDQLDGVNILFAFVFVSAVMENVAASIATAPLLMLWLCTLAFAVFFVIFLATTFVFGWAGRKQALALAFMASQRNMGLMLAATGGALPELTWLYFAAAQLPIYLSPLLLTPLARRAAHSRDA